MKQRYLIFSFKLLFIAVSFTLIFLKADIGKIWFYIKTIPPIYLIACYLLMTIAQIISAQRMRFYYANDNLKLSRKFSTGLYFTAMLFNTILPGGIGGDGYKIYLLGKLSGFSHLRALKITISERASGLFALLILTSIFYAFANFANIIPYQNYAIITATILVIPAYFICIRLLLKESSKTAIGATFFSFPIQFFNIVTAFLLLAGLGTDMGNIFDIMGYLVIFLISSVASVLPITIGGAGLREITFLYAAKFAGMNAELGISVAILFFVVNILCALNGLLFWHKLEKIYNS